MSGWLWMLRKFGLRTTYAYWREGQRRGWMTDEQSAKLLRGLAPLKNHDELTPVSGCTCKGTGGSSHYHCVCCECQKCRPTRERNEAT